MPFGVSNLTSGYWPGIRSSFRIRHHQGGGGARMAASRGSPREEVLWLTLFSALFLVAGGWVVYGGCRLWPSDAQTADAARTPAAPNLRALGSRHDDPLQLD